MNQDKDLNLFLDQFYKAIYVDFGIAELTDKIKNWYNLTWEEFRNELFSFNIKGHAALLKDWEYFFHHQKNKVLALVSRKVAEVAS